MKPTRYLLTIVITVLLWTGCSRKEPAPPPSALYSVNGGTTSHKNGQICLTCHVTGGSAVNFVIAGSVFKADSVTPSSNGILYFWTQQGGTGLLVATLEVDANGNFFTNSSILPALGAFPQMRGISGAVKNMPILALTGNCNSCHGVNEAPIWIN